MKRLTVSRLSLVSLATLALGLSFTSIAQANTQGQSRLERQAAEIAMIGKTEISSEHVSLTPFHLVTLAYQGKFHEQGVASAGRLISEYQWGRITAQDLVDAAIQQNYLDAKYQNDSSYLTYVNQQLFALSQNG